MSNGTKTQIKPQDWKVGQSVVGYVKALFKNPKSQYNPDVENIELVQKDGTVVTIWAGGDLNYFRERMTQKGADLGVLCKIERTEPRLGKNGKPSRQKYFFNMGFNINDTKSIEELGGNDRMTTDDQGFEY